jgi:hypothetical protein
MATETNITVNPNPILKIAILTMGREKLALFFESILRAINSSVFTEMYIFDKVKNNQQTIHQFTTSPPD